MTTISRKDAVQKLKDAIERGKVYDSTIIFEAGCWHLGNCELRAFFDDVWGPPTCREEEIYISNME